MEMKQELTVDQAIERVFEIVGFKVKDNIMSKVIGIRHLDQDDFMSQIVARDKDIDLDGEMFLYKGKPFSLADYCSQKYSPEEYRIIEQAFHVGSGQINEVPKLAAKAIVQILSGIIGQAGIPDEVYDKVKKDQREHKGAPEQWHELIGELNDIFGLKVQVDVLSSLKKNRPIINIVALDQKLSEKDSEYNATNSLWGDQKISMCDYVNIKYGKRASDLIEFFIGKKEFREVWVK